MPKQPPSAPLRAQLRERIISRIAELKLRTSKQPKNSASRPGR